MYDLVFGYEHGDPERPRFAAGTGLLLSGKMFFDYRGAIFWKMTAGMGDVVFAPLYEALRARGVGFRFFHRVDRVRAERRRLEHRADRPRRPGELADGVETYEPLVDVGGLRCWPAAPRHELLDGTGEYRRRLRVASGRASPTSGRRRLRAGHDFDAVVLAIPVGMHRSICGDLIDNARTPQWRAMTDGLRTVATKAMQLWLRADEGALGWSARRDHERLPRGIPHVCLDVRAHRRRAMAGRRCAGDHRVLL